MDKKDAILQATMQLVSENGFHATPMSLVAKRANVAAGTIYHYYESKEQLINALYVQLVDQMNSDLLEKDEQGKNYKERFFNFWLCLYDFFIENPQAFLFLEQYANAPFMHQYSKNDHKHQHLMISNFLEQGVKSGILRDINLKLMAALMYGSVSSTVKLSLSKEITINKTLLNSAMQSCWDGLKIT